MAVKDVTYVNSLIEYIGDIKPYHCKMAETIVEYQHSDTFTASIHDSHVMTVNQSSSWCTDFVWSGTENITDLYARTIPLPDLQIPRYVGGFNNRTTSATALPKGGVGYSDRVNVVFFDNEEVPRIVYTTVAGVVTHLEILYAGSGFILPPDITIGHAYFTGTDAVFSSTLNEEGGIASIQILDGGSGYFQPGSQAFLTGSFTAGLSVISTINDNFNISIDGGTSTSISLTAGNYNSTSELASHIQTKINIALGARTVTVKETDGVLSITSNTLGSLSGVVVTTGTNSGKHFIFGGDTPVLTTVDTFSDADQTGSSVATLVITNNINDKFIISVDGGESVEVTLIPGTYTSSTLITEVQTKINIALFESNQITSSVTVLESSGILRIISDKKSLTSSIAVTTKINIGNTDLLGSSPIVTTLNLVTQAVQIGSEWPGMEIISGVNDNFNVSVDGGSPVSVTLIANTYDFFELFATHVQTQINAALTLGSVTVTAIDSILHIASNKLGIGSAVSITAGTNTGNINLLGSSPITTVESTITQAMQTSLSTAGLIITSGANDNFNISIDGGLPVSITLAAATYTYTTLVIEIRTQINNALIAAGQTSKSVTVIANSGKISVISNTLGTTSNIDIIVGTNSGKFDLFGSSPISSIVGATTQAVLTGSSVVNFIITDNINDKFMIAVDRDNAVGADLIAGIYTDTALVTEVQTKINAALNTAGQTTSVTVSIIDDIMSIMSNTLGPGSDVQVTAKINIGNTDLLGISPITSTVIAGTQKCLTGESAIGMLISATNNSFNISLNGGDPVTVTLASGTYSKSSLAIEVQTKINATLIAAGQAPSTAKVVINISGKMIVISNNSSEISAVSVTSDGLNLGKINLFGSSPVQSSFDTVNSQQNFLTFTGGDKAIYFNAMPPILTTSTNNNIPLLSLTTTPLEIGEQIIVKAINNETVILSAFISDTVGRSVLNSAVWDFTTWSGVDDITDADTIITHQVYAALPLEDGIQLSVTGSGTTRTVTAFDTLPLTDPLRPIVPFSEIIIVASLVNTAASYLQTPLGLYQIISRISDSEIIIGDVPSSYINETAITAYTWNKLFSVTGPAITAITPNYAPNFISTISNTYSITTTTKIGVIDFIASANSRTATIVFNSVERNTNISTSKRQKVYPYAKAVIVDGSINFIDVIESGSGFISIPQVLIHSTGIGTGFNGFIHTLNSNGGIDIGTSSVIVSNGGYGYSTNLYLDIESSAIVSCSIFGGQDIGKISEILLENPGSNFYYYSGPIDADNYPNNLNDPKHPKIIIEGGGGSGGTAHAIVNPDGTLADIILDTIGSGYITAPIIKIDGGIIVHENIANYGTISDFYVVYGGSGYANNPKITVRSRDNEEGGTLINSFIDAGTVSSIEIFKQNLEFTIVPTISLLSSQTIPPTEVATAKAVLYYGSLASIHLTNPGSGYVPGSLSTIASISGGGPRGPETIEATANVIVNDDGTIKSVSITNNGTGYLYPPSITIIGAGTGAKAVANVNFDKSIKSIDILNPGLGYTEPPIVFINGAIPLNNTTDISPDKIENGIGCSISAVTINGSIPTGRNSITIHDDKRFYRARMNEGHNNNYGNRVSINDLILTRNLYTYHGIFSEIIEIDKSVEINPTDIIEFVLPIVDNITIAQFNSEITDFDPIIRIPKLSPETQAVLTGAVAAGLSITTSSNNGFMISVDGGTPVSVTLVAGNYTPASLASAVQAKANAALILAGQNTKSVYVTANTEGKLSITSNTFGTNSYINVTTRINTGKTSLLGSSPVSSTVATVTQAMQTGSAVAGLTIINGVNDNFNISIDSGTPVSVTLTSGNYHSTATLAIHSQSKINAALVTAGQTTKSVSVSTSASKISITSNTLGITSAVNISTGTNTGKTNLMGSSPVSSTIAILTQAKLTGSLAAILEIQGGLNDNFKISIDNEDLVSVTLTADIYTLLELITHVETQINTSLFAAGQTTKSVAVTESAGIIGIMSNTSGLTSGVNVVLGTNTGKINLLGISPIHSRIISTLTQTTVGDYKNIIREDQIIPIKLESNFLISPEDPRFGYGGPSDSSGIPEELLNENDEVTLVVALDPYDIEGYEGGLATVEFEEKQITAIIDKRNIVDGKHIISTEPQQIIGWICSPLSSNDVVTNLLDSYAFIFNPHWLNGIPVELAPGNGVGYDLSVPKVKYGVTGHAASLDVFRFFVKQSDLYDGQVGTSITEDIKFFDLIRLSESLKITIDDSVNRESWNKRLGSLLWETEGFGLNPSKINPYSELEYPYTLGNESTPNHGNGVFTLLSPIANAPIRYPAPITGFAVDEVITIEFLSATTFTVIGTISTHLPNGQINIPYNSRGLQFVINDGGILFVSGDKFFLNITMKQLTIETESNFLITEEDPRLRYGGPSDLSGIPEDIGLGAGNEVDLFPYDIQGFDGAINEATLLPIVTVPVHVWPRFNIYMHEYTPEPQWFIDNATNPLYADHFARKNNWNIVTNGEGGEYNFFGFHDYLVATISEDTVSPFDLITKIKLPGHTKPIGGWDIPDFDSPDGWDYGTPDGIITDVNFSETFIIYSQTTEAIENDGFDGLTFYSSIDGSPFDSVYLDDLHSIAIASLGNSTRLAVGIDITQLLLEHNFTYTLPDYPPIVPGTLHPPTAVLIAHNMPYNPAINRKTYKITSDVPCYFTLQF